MFYLSWIIAIKNQKNLNQNNYFEIKLVKVQRGAKKNRTNRLSPFALQYHMN